MYKLTGWDHHLRKVKIMWEKCVTLCFLLMFLILFWWGSLSPWFSDGLIRVELKPRGNFSLTQEEHPTEKQICFNWKQGHQGVPACIIIPKRKKIYHTNHIHTYCLHWIITYHLEASLTGVYCLSENFWEPALQQGGCFDGMIDGGPVGANSVGIIGGSGCH